MIKLIILLLVALTSLKSFAFEKKVLLQSDGIWKVIKSGNSCFLMAQPSHSKGFTGFRDTPYFFIKKDKVNAFHLGVFSGFTLDDNKPVVVSTQNRSFILQSYRSSFASNNINFNQKSFIDALLEDSQFLVVTTPHINNSSVRDYYNIKNLSQILKFLQNPC